MYQQRIEEKRCELENAQIMVRAARNAVVDAECKDCVSGSAFVHLQTELTHAEENASRLAAELDALNELQADHFRAASIASE